MPDGKFMLLRDKLSQLPQKQFMFLTSIEFTKGSTIHNTKILSPIIVDRKKLLKFLELLCKLPKTRNNWNFFPKGRLSKSLLEKSPFTLEDINFMHKMIFPVGQIYDCHTITDISVIPLSDSINIF